MSTFINSYSWIIIVFLHYLFISYLSFKVKNQDNLLYLIWAMSLIPMWAIICKYSNDLALTGLIYDVVVMLGWSIGIILFSNKSLSYMQYIGMVVIIIGLITFKVGES